MTKRFAIASAIGGLVGTICFILVLFESTGELTRWQRNGDFYDAQAHAWLDGRWDIDPDVLGIERFEARGRSYMYQGPVPALLRVPVVALTDELDGRLTQLSMLGAFLVALTFVTRLHWQIRSLVRGDAPLGLTESVAVGVATFATTGGSVLVFAASRAWVYHEALMWGVAFTIGAMDALVSCAQRSTARRMLWASLLATLAVSSRASVGIGAVVGLGLLAATGLVRWWASGGRRSLRGLLPVIGTGVAALAPVAAYAAVNWIKFRSALSVPFESQGISLADPLRQEFLERNGGTLFGLQFIPTTVIQYTRPDALELTGAFPFVDFASPTGPVGDVRFDLIDRAASIPTVMPALLVAALIGAWSILRGRQGGSPDAPSLRLLWIPAVAGLTAGLTILPFGYIAQRYLPDLLPGGIVLGLVGLHVLLDEARAIRWRTPMMSVLAVLVLVSSWINPALALIYQRLYSPNVPADTIAGFLDTRYDVAQALGVPPGIPIAQGDSLPESGRRGDLFVIGDCDALYLNDGVQVDTIHFTPWNAVQRSEAGGLLRLAVTFPEAVEGTSAPLVSVDGGDGQIGLLWAEHVAGGWELAVEGVGLPARSDPLDLAGPEPHELELVVDRHVQSLELLVDGRPAFSSIAFPDLEPSFVIDRNTSSVPTTSEVWTGSIQRLPEQTDVCRELLEEAQR